MSSRVDMTHHELHASHDNSSPFSFVCLEAEYGREGTVLWKLHPQAARDLAARLIQQAEDAESFSQLMAILQEKWGLPEEAALRMVKELDVARTFQRGIEQNGG